MPNAVKSYINQRFGQLTVVSKAIGHKSGAKVRTCWNCLCDCGNSLVVLSASLVTKNTRSCGCIALTSRTTHGLYNEPLFLVYRNMKKRCYDPRNIKYKRYGGRGITICNQWLLEPRTFIEWGKSNGYASGLEINRINNNGNYEPDNCEFVDRKTNMNNCSTNRILEYRGRNYTLSQLVEKCEIASYDCIRIRLNRGWNVTDAVTTPIRLDSRHKHVLR